MNCDPVGDDGGDARAGEGAQEDIEKEAEADSGEFRCVPCEEGEADQPKKVRSPGSPSPQEVDDHNLTHCPYRSWCEHCVRGQTKDCMHPSVEVGPDEKGVA